MRLRIREHKGLHQKITLEGHNMKLGPGSIREIEFFTQTRQIIAGGRDPDLRLRQTVPALRALASKGWVPEDVAETLIENYRHFREIEHRIQMVNDAQTHVMPTSKEGIARVAGLMGLEPGEMLKGIARRLDEVAELTEDFFAPDTPAKPASAAQHEFDKEVLARWPTYPALRSDRAVQIFGRLRPQLLERLARAVRPDEALLAFGPAPPAGAMTTLNLSERGDLVEAAANLFAMLHVLDDPSHAAIAVMPIPDRGLGAAINDRLRRAAAPRDRHP